MTTLQHLEKLRNDSHHMCPKCLGKILSQCYLNSHEYYLDIFDDSYHYKKTEYFHFGQYISGRNGHLLGVEILSRVLSTEKRPTDYERYYQDLNQHNHKKLLIEILNKICTFVAKDQCSPDTKFFVNIERFSLLDSEIIKSIIKANSFINAHNGSNIVLEITERNPSLKHYTLENKFRLKDAGVQLAMDDSIIRRIEMIDYNLTLYDFIKFDMRFIREMLVKDNSSNSYMELLYWCAENNIKPIAERVEFKEDYQLVSKMPFQYLQGFYDDINKGYN